MAITFPIVPLTFNWTVPAGLPNAGVVRPAYILIPPNPLAEPRAVFFQWSAYTGGGVWLIPEPNDPTTQALVQAGIYVFGVDQSFPFDPVLGGNGSYAAYRTEIPAFVNYVQGSFLASTRPVSLFVRSRGGMWMNTAADIPGFYDRIAGLAPITDAQSYDPIGIAEIYTGNTTNPPAVTEFSQVPSVACPTLPTPAGSPISLLQQNAVNFRTSAFVSSNVPMYIAYGTADGTVVPSTNILTFQTNYLANGGNNLQLLEVIGASHATVTTTCYQPLINFMLEQFPTQTVTNMPFQQWLNTYPWIFSS